MKINKSEKYKKKLLKKKIKTGHDHRKYISEKKRFLIILKEKREKEKLNKNNI